MTHTIDLLRLTVIATDATGESHDLNAQGEPCETVDDLRDFIIQLHGERAYDVDTMRELLAELPGPVFVRA